ncbi:hypothetical protein [Sphingomonas sp. IC4-52]|uniref:hypothetical protein n=1 Tax=Sphingomonas sp. IC4-52 TaxID=2887202 RepID=UPI001D12FB67|nr:hypothetical protein [Sphingomonas sp. IC4-52]MCC2981269.1 hypothetical protein [Sphingomonas sp. IC4-52]
MATTVEISIAGREDADAPLLGDLIEQIQDFFAMLNGVTETLTGDAIERFDWKVVGLSKNSPARITVEAIPLPGHSDGPQIAERAREITVGGLRQLIAKGERPLYFSDNVIEAADRFLRRMTRQLSATTVGSSDAEATEVTVGTVAAIEALRHVEIVREAEPVHPYRELGSFEGYIQNVGTDGWQRPFIIVKSRVTGADVKCYLSGEALRALEDEPVAQVVWRNRRVTAVGVLKYRSVGRLSQAEVTRLDFADPDESLPQLKDIIDLGFTDGLSSHEYLERVRNGEA